MEVVPKNNHSDTSTIKRKNFGFHKQKGMQNDNLFRQFGNKERVNKNSNMGSQRFRVRRFLQAIFSTEFR